MILTTRTKVTILLVQNAQTQGNGTKLYLEGAGYTVVWAGSGVSALAAAKQQTVDLILIDVALPDIEGGELCRRFRGRDATRTVPIILLTARGQTPSISKGADGGPDDYVPKPYADGELEARIAAALKTRAVRPPAPVGASVTKEVPAPPTIVPVRGVEPRPDSGPLDAGAQRTLSREAQRPEAIRTGPKPQLLPGPEVARPGSPAALTGGEVIDPATGLFGKKQFEAMFAKEFKRSVRFKQQMSCMLIDLDGRRMGRPGDAATLREIIKLVQNTIREVDTAAWWSGEALIILLPNTIRNDAMQAAARILESVANHPFSWSDSYKVTMSIGVAGLPNRKITSEQKMIEAAADACRRARDLMLPNGEA